MDKEEFQCRQYAMMPRSSVLDRFVAAIKARDQRYGQAALSPMWKQDLSTAHIQYERSVQGVPPCR